MTVNFNPPESSFLSDDDCVRSTCYFCGGCWMECVCPELSIEEGFDTGDMVITEPCVSECGRFYVDPVLAYGEAYKKWLAERERLGLWPAPSVTGREDA